MIKKFVFNITPQSWPRATQKDKVFFRIPREALRKDGLKRLNRLERYNKYKVSLLSMANQQKFVLPEQGAEIFFYMPIPRTWRKHKKASMLGKLHQQKPDLSNMLKALEDSFLAEDKYVANYKGLSKIWAEEGCGRIEIVVHYPEIRSKDTLL